MPLVINRSLFLHVLGYGAAMAMLVLLLRWMEIRFFILDHSTEIYVGGIALIFTGLGMWLAHQLTRPKEVVVEKITFIENPGMAFGIDVGPKMFLTIFTIIASLFIFFYIFKHRKDGILIRLSLALILAGAIGNLIDRTFYGVIYNYAPLFNGKVVDFMQVEFWDFTILGRTYTTWPIWNIADASVSAGFLIILFFHNRIFKTNEPVPVIGDDTQVSPPVDGEYPIEPDKIVLEENSIQSGDEENNNSAFNLSLEIDNFHCFFFTESPNISTQLPHIPIVKFSSMNLT